MRDDETRRFLNMSGGLLLAVLAAVIALPVLCCVGTLVIGMVSDAAR